jgi:hypothetical protein
LADANTEFEKPASTPPILEPSAKASKGFNPNGAEIDPVPFRPKDHLTI